MKNALTFSLVLLAGHFTSLYAQPDLAIGIRGGITACQTNGEVLINGYVFDQTSSTTGFTVGLPIEIGFNDLFAVQPELNFTQKGYGIKATNAPIDYSFTFSYLELPVLAKVRFGGEAFKVNLLAGPSIGLAVGKIQLSDGSETVGKYTYEEFLAKKIDFGLQGGLGLSYQLGGVQIFADARYMLGLSDISDNADESYKHTGINIGLGALISL